MYGLVQSVRGQKKVAYRRALPEDNRWHTVFQVSLLRAILDGGRVPILHLDDTCGNKDAINIS